MSISERITGYKVHDPASDFNSQVVDILINETGHIEKITVSEVPEEGDLYPAFCDLRTELTDPGKEWKQSLSSLKQGMCHSGFGHIVCHPAGGIPFDTAEIVGGIQTRLKIADISASLIANLTLEGKGERMVDLYHLKEAGVHLFSDGNASPIKDGIVQRLLDYSKALDIRLMLPVFDINLAEGSLINEGLPSLKLGLKGSPALAESVQIQKVVSLLRYHGGKVHLGPVSSKEGLSIIRDAKAEGLDLSCDVALPYLIYTDTDILDYDTTFKLNPPLRSSEDQDALWEGLLDGTIDAISSGHSPQGIDEKRLEYDQADFGMATHDNFLHLLSKAIRKRNIQAERLFHWLCDNPWKIAGRSTPVIEVNSPWMPTLIPSNLSENTLVKNQNAPYNLVMR